MTERKYLTGNKLKGKNLRFQKKLDHLMEKFHFRIDQEIQAYFMINPDLTGNG